MNFSSRQAHIYLLHPCDISTLIMIGVASCFFLVLPCTYLIFLPVSRRKLYLFIVLFSSACTVYIHRVLFVCYTRNSGVLLSIYHCHYIRRFFRLIMRIHIYVLIFMSKKSKLIYVWRTKKVIQRTRTRARVHCACY